MRQTGRTTKMLTQAVMSDAPIVVIAAPTGSVIIHLKRMLLDLVGKPSRITEREIEVGNKHYFFIIPIRNAVERFWGIRDFDLFHDHTLFEDAFYEPELVTSYDELRELVRRRKDLKEEKK